MSDAFDPYYKWLGIPPEEQPPNHYRLLGIKLFESDADVIDNAADRQMAHVRTFQAGRHSDLSQKLLNEISAARVCLLNAAARSGYDAALRTLLPPRPPVHAAPPPPAFGTAPPPARRPVPSVAAVPVAVPVASDGLEDVAQFVDATPSDYAHATHRHRKKSLAVPLSLGIVVLGIAAAGAGYWFATRPDKSVGDDSAGTELAAADQEPPVAGDNARDDKKSMPTPGPAAAGTPTTAGRDPDSSKNTSNATTVPNPPPPVEADLPPAEIQSASLARLLPLVRRALAERRMAQAGSYLVAAQRKSTGTAQEAEVKRLILYLKMIQEFWAASGKAAGKLEAGDEIANANGDPVAVVAEVSGDRLTIRWRGRQLTATVTGLPADVALALVQRELPDNPASKLCLAAFATMDAGGNRDEARALWDEAESGGGKTALFRPELEIALPSGLIPAGGALTVVTGSGKPPVDATAGTIGEPIPPIDPPPPKPKPTPTPPPDDPTWQAAVKQLREDRKSEFDQASRPADKLKLAERLLAEGTAGSDTGSTRIDPIARYALFVEARRLGMAARSPAMVLRAVEHLADWYTLDGVQTAEQAVTEMLAREMPSEAWAELVSAGGVSINRAESAAKFAIAIKLATQLTESARRAEQWPLSRQMNQARLRIEEIEKQTPAVEAARKVLADKPADPDANLTVGRFLCLLKSDWEQGLSHLSQSADHALAELARRELAKPEDAQAQLKLADAWWDLGEKEKPPFRDPLQAWAATWYQKSVAELTGLSKTKAEKRLAELAARVPAMKATKNPADPKAAAAPSADWRLPQGAVLVFTFENETLDSLGETLTVRDAAAGSNRGLAHGVRSAIGQAGNALAFGDASDYIDVPSAPSLDLEAALTISVWIRPESDAGEIVNKCDQQPQPRGFALRMVRPGAVIFMVANSAGWVEGRTAQPLRPGRWFHLAATHDSREIKLYVDGKQQDAASAPAPLTITPLSLKIGHGVQGQSRPFRGTIDELALFARALTADEIRQLYDRGAAGLQLVE